MPETTAATALAFVKSVNFEDPSAFVRPQQQDFLSLPSVQLRTARFGWADLTLSGLSAPTPSSAASSDATTAASVIDALGIKGDIAQAFAAGSNVTSFDASVSAELREAAATTTLFCQLLADQACPDHSTPGWAASWYAIYRSTFTKLGWIVQDEQTVDSTDYKTAASVQQALISLIASTIGKQGADAIEAALNSLSSLGGSDPVITLYRTQTQQFTIDEASASVATDSGDGFLFDLVEFSFSATGQDFQALFFHWKTTAVQYSYNKLRLSLDLSIWNKIKDEVAQKLADKLTLINQLPDLSS